MPLPSWMQGASSTEDVNKVTSKVEELTGRFASIETSTAENKTQLSEIKSKLAVLDDVSAFIADQKKQRTEAAAAAAAARSQQSTQEEDENMASNLLTDPRAVINRVTKPERDAILAVRAQQLRSETFNDPDNHGEFKFYAGDIKKEVNELIASQPLEFQVNAQNLRNCYNTVLGRHTDEILEGKIKSRFASASGGSASSGNSTSGNDGGSREIKVTPDIIRAAILTGFSTEEYVKMLVADEEAGL